MKVNLNLAKHIPNAVTSRFGRQLLVGQKHAPTLMFGAGVVGVIATAVLTARATLKIEDLLEISEGNRDAADIMLKADREDYTAADYTKDIAKIRMRTTISVAKLYAPPIIVGVSSIGLLTGSHITLNRRNVGLTAAYAALDKGYSDYRERVLKEVGEDKEREFRHASETREIVEEGKNGPKVRQIKTAVKDPNGYSTYARFFDEANQNWQRQAEYNFVFIRCQQQYANDLLHSRGHIFLNEVYDMLGIERSSAGAMVGWVMSKDGGDNFVDFGVFDGTNEKARDFVNGREGSILLDFNVDGVIYDKI